MLIQRTTVTLPIDLLEAARVTAFHRRMSVSALVRKGLEEVICDQPKKQKSKTKQTKTPLEQFVGGLSLGFKGIEREKIYENYFRKKMST